MAYQDRIGLSPSAASFNLPTCARRHLKRIRLDLSKVTNLGSTNDRERTTALDNAFSAESQQRHFDELYGFDTRTRMPKAIAVTGANGVLTPYVFTKKTQFFAPTHGIIDSGGRHYQNFEVGDPVRIWATVSRRGAGHLCCEIENGGRRYSFGFAYAGSGKLEERIGHIGHSVSEIDGAVYSPDFLFAARLVQQYAKPQNEYLRLVGQGTLTAAHVKAMRDRFDTVADSHMNAFRFIRREWPGPNASSEKQVEASADFLDTLHDLFDEQLKVETDAEQHKWLEKYTDVLLKKPDQHPGGIVAYDHTYTWFYRDQPYCEYSRRGGRTANCTSFLHAIFPDLITCSVSGIVENPEWCTALAESECSRTGRPTGR